MDERYDTRKHPEFSDLGFLRAVNAKAASKLSISVIFAMKETAPDK